MTNPDFEVLESTAKVVAGPGKWDLMLSIFDLSEKDDFGRANRGPTFTVRHESGSTQEHHDVKIHAIRRRGRDEFELEGRIIGGPFWGTYNTRTREGEMTWR